MRRLVLCVALVGVAGCPADPPPACVTVDLNCTPVLYPPTFDNVYAMTLKDSCGSQRNSCHSEAGHSGGLAMGDEASAYTHLLENDRVVPGDPACSKMIVRVTSVGDTYQMPQGPASSALSAGGQCSLIHWIAAGAPGPGSAP